jgi:hypothetical protein
MEAQTEPKVKKTADKKKYIREYKKKHYAENTEEMKIKNKNYYYKYKFNLSPTDIELYGELTPQVSKVIDLFAQIKAQRPELIDIILQKI